MDTHQPLMEMEAGIIKRGSQVMAVFVLLALILFAAAGSLDWTWAWVLLGIYIVGVLANLALMLHINPGIIALRAETSGIKGWDKLVGGLWGLIYYLIIPLISGLDFRFAWTGPVSTGLHLAGGLLFALGLGLFSWAMLTNAYFSTVSRVLAGEQQVCDRGPYRAVRHPGYVGAILQTLGAPLLLGSRWGFAAGVAAAILMIIRTDLEDRMLHAELPGYPGYAHRVHYRLLPGIW